MRPRILIVVYSRLAMDARVLRQVRWLSAKFDVTSAAFGPSPIQSVNHIELANPAPYRGGILARFLYVIAFILGRFAWLTSRNPRDIAAIELLGAQEWDVVIANDVTVLPLAAKLNAQFGVLADLHEYSPKQASESLIFRLTEARYFTWMLKTFLGRVSRVTTVSHGIAEEYLREFGVMPAVVANAAEYRELAPNPVGAPIRIVHSAAPSPARRIEVMIKAVRDTTSNVTLDLYLVDNGSTYMSELRALASEIDRVTIHDAIPNSELINVLARYDIGIHLLPPINFNHRWALPNKLFDYVQARLGIVIGPSPEMARVVEEYELGAVARNFSAKSLTRLLDGIDADSVNEWKQASHRAARELSGESQLQRFEEVIRDMLSSPEVE